MRENWGWGWVMKSLIFYISYHYLISVMPPKKKINKASDEASPADTIPKPAEKVEAVVDQKK